MSTPEYVSEDTLVAWYFTPRLAEATETPELPYDHPVETLQESIDFTMQYVTAAQPPFGQGRPRRIIRTVQGNGGHLTLFWPLYEVREDNRVQTPDGVRTETIIRYYGFDARRQLMAETVISHSREDVYRNFYSWPHEEVIPPEHRAKLMEKLSNFRRELSS